MTTLPRKCDGCGDQLMHYGHCRKCRVAKLLDFEDVPVPFTLEQVKWLRQWLRYGAERAEYLGINSWHDFASALDIPLHAAVPYEKDGAS